MLLAFLAGVPITSRFKFGLRSSLRESLLLLATEAKATKESMQLQLQHALAFANCVSADALKSTYRGLREEALRIGELTFLRFASFARMSKRTKVTTASGAAKDLSEVFTALESSGFLDRYRLDEKGEPIATEVLEA